MISIDFCLFFVYIYSMKTQPEEGAPTEA
jgi:hypothetical protein